MTTSPDTGRDRCAPHLVAGTARDDLRVLHDVDACAQHRTGSVVTSPDRDRSAWWNGTAGTLDNATVFAGVDCSGALLFTATLVHATTAEEAAAAAQRVGLQAAPQSLGATGSTGVAADHLWYCGPPADGGR